MSLPYVTKVAFKNGQIVLRIEVDEYLVDESVEISGYATQNGGGFASFYDLKVVEEEADGTTWNTVTNVGYGSGGDPNFQG